MDNDHDEEGGPGEQVEAADGDDHGAGLAQPDQGANAVGGSRPVRLLPVEPAGAYLDQHAQVEGRDGGERSKDAQHDGGQEEGAMEVAVVAAGAPVSTLVHGQAGEAGADHAGDPHQGDGPGYQLRLGDQQPVVQERVTDGAVALDRDKYDVELGGQHDEEADEQDDVAQPGLHEGVVLQQPQDEERDSEGPDLPNNQHTFLSNEQHEQGWRGIMNAPTCPTTSTHLVSAIQTAGAGMGVFFFFGGGRGSIKKSDYFTHGIKD